jgi:hypothetical protein
MSKTREAAAKLVARTRKEKQNTHSKRLTATESGHKAAHSSKSIGSRDKSNLKYRSNKNENIRPKNHDLCNEALPN